MLTFVVLFLQNANFKSRALAVHHDRRHFQLFTLDYLDSNISDAILLETPRSKHQGGNINRDTAFGTQSNTSSKISFQHRS
jgi:hypothetical protein